MQRRRKKLFHAIVVVGASLTGACDLGATPTLPPPAPPDMATAQPDLAMAPPDLWGVDQSGEDLTAPPDLARNIIKGGDGGGGPVDAFKGW